MLPHSAINFQLSRSSTALPTKRASLIDNTLAVACTLKRSRACVVAGNSSGGCCSTLPSSLKKSRSDSGVIATVKVKTIVCSNSNNSDSSPDLLKQHHLKHHNHSDTTCPKPLLQSASFSSKDENSPSIVVQTKEMLPLDEMIFIPPTEEQIAGYAFDAISAVRTNDVPALRAIHKSGRSLSCCNRFGESLLHVACRRSDADVVSFLLNEADVSPVIKDDFGRTPLHDACWRGSPEYEIVELLLSVEPRLAFVKDVRGHVPFRYARREHWGAWREFLEQRRDLILS